MIAVTPASSSNCGPSGNGKNASIAATRALHPLTGFCNRNAGSIHAIHLPRSAAQQHLILRDDDRRCSSRACRPARRISGLPAPLASAGDCETTFQFDFFDAEQVALLDEISADDLVQVKFVAIELADRPTSSSRNVLPSLAREPRHRGRSRRDDHFQQFVDRRDRLRGRQIDRFDSAPRFRQTPPADRLRNAARNAVGRSSAVAQPHGVACFTMQAAGVCEFLYRRQAPSASSRLMYDSSLPCSCLAKCDRRFIRLALPTQSAAF